MIINCDILINCNILPFLYDTKFFAELCGLSVPSRSDEPINMIYTNMMYVKIKV